LLPAKELPWQNAPPTAPPQIQIDHKKLGRELLGLHVRKHPLPGTGLIPTAPDTDAERYVDTAAEADLIALAAKLGEVGQARDLLRFYRNKLQWDATPLHASYDAEAGTAMTKEWQYPRPLQAPRTASAQLAMADAAFSLGLKTREGDWLKLGKNLTTVLLEKFRPETASGLPRGITEFEFVSTRTNDGLTLWPEAQVYLLRSNAKAYLLFQQINQEVLTHFTFDQEWEQQI